jgi:hypothetical protein
MRQTWRSLPDSRARSAPMRDQLLTDGSALAQVPLLQVEALLAALAGPAVAAVLEARFRQIVHDHHDADSDDMLPLCWLPKKARDFASIAVDRLGGIDGQRDFPKGRRRLANVAALALASIDRLDRATKSGRGDVQLPDHAADRQA